MSPETQTIVALAIVGLTAAALLWSVLRKKKAPGCGCGDACTAMTPELKKLQSRAGK